MSSLASGIASLSGCVGEFGEAKAQNGIQVRKNDQAGFGPSCAQFARQCDDVLEARTANQSICAG